MTVTEETVRRLNREAPLTDVHVHPSLKAFLFRRNLWRHYSSGWMFNPFASRSDFRMIRKGQVGVVWAAHYLPEREIFTRCPAAKFAAMIVVPAYLRLLTGELFDRLMQMMDRMERETARRPDRTELARSPADVRRVVGEGRIAVVHTVEGAHVLQGSLENLERLADRGVAMLTLTHFYDNKVAMPTNAIPAGMIPEWICKLTPELDETQGLTAFGEEVVETMVELGMIVDVSHCNRKARGDVYQIVDGRSPIVASHVGVRSLMNDKYNLDADEMRTIADCGGAVGIIFFNHWLEGAPDHPLALDAGLLNIWATASAIRDVTGGWDHVMLGTDFDGFTDPIDDVEDSSKMQRVTSMLLRMGLDEGSVRKVIGGNAQRVLDSGWRGRAM